MAWAVTLKVTDCNTNGKLVSAFITDGAVTYYTDANGQFIAIVDDVWHTYIVNIGKSGYITKSFTLHRASMEGTIQTICLNPSVDNGGSTETSDGW